MNELTFFLFTFTQDMLQQFLVMLNSHSDISLRFLCFRLDFNEHYKKFEPKLRSPMKYSMRYKRVHQNTKYQRNTGFWVTIISGKIDALFSTVHLILIKNTIREDSFLKNPYQLSKDFTLRIQWLPSLARKLSIKNKSAEPTQHLHSQSQDNSQKSSSDEPVFNEAANVQPTRFMGNVLYEGRVQSIL